MEALFHEAIEFSVVKLGVTDLKKEQYNVSMAICVEKKRCTGGIAHRVWKVPNVSRFTCNV